MKVLVLDAYQKDIWQLLKTSDICTNRRRLYREVASRKIMRNLGIHNPKIDSFDLIYKAHQFKPQKILHDHPK